MFYWPFQGCTSFVDHLCYFMSCVCHAFACSSPAWLLFVILSLSHVFTLVRCGTWLYWFLIFANFPCHHKLYLLWPSFFDKTSSFELFLYRVIQETFLWSLAEIGLLKQMLILGRGTLTLPASVVLNSFDPDQARQNVGPNLDPNCLTHWWYSWKNFSKQIVFLKISRRWEHTKLPSRQGVKWSH